MRWSSQIPAGFLVSRGTWVSDPGRLIHFAYRTVTFYGSPFQTIRLYISLVTSRADPKLAPIGSHDPEYTTLSGLTYIRFGLFPVRSPLLRKSLLFSLPEDTKMFQFSSFASLAYVFSNDVTGLAVTGFPIQKSPDQSLFSSSPKLIAASHVFHRLLTPRHPPFALNSLATK
jgi:hypothetical protein